MIVKRLVDIMVSSIGLIFCLPLYLFLFIKIKKNLGSPTIFTQTRPGLGGKPFKMYKFRSMQNATDSTGHILPDSIRLTPFGQKLRSSSLDELPELSLTRNTVNQVKLMFELHGSEKETVFD